MAPLTLSQDFLEEFREVLQSAGYALTRQRVAVVQAIFTLGEVEDAEELWLYINQEQKISLAAVYSCLNLLVRHGYLQKVEQGKCAGYKLIIFSNSAR